VVSGGTSGGPTQLGVLQSHTHQGTGEGGVLTYEVSITVEAPTASEDIVVRAFDRTLTMTEVVGVIIGGTSATINPVHGNDRSAAGTNLFAAPQVISSFTTGDSLTTFADATLNAGDMLRLKTTAVSGSVTQLSVTFKFTG
jgi:hypothetical protein